LSVRNRDLTLLVADEELARRARERPVSAPAAVRGYRKLFLEHVTQADLGADFDFMRAPSRVGTVPRG
jgi:dihydroxy-acid dehydratase